MSERPHVLHLDGGVLVLERACTAMPDDSDPHELMHPLWVDFWAARRAYQEAGLQARTIAELLLWEDAWWQQRGYSSYLDDTRPEEFATCRECGGSGWVPTEAGAALLAFVRDYGLRVTP